MRAVCGYNALRCGSEGCSCGGAAGGAGRCCGCGSALKAAVMGCSFCVVVLRTNGLPLPPRPTPPTVPPPLLLPVCPGNGEKHPHPTPVLPEWSTPPCYSLPSPCTATYPAPVSPVLPTTATSCPALTSRSRSTRAGGCFGSQPKSPVSRTAVAPVTRFESCFLGGGVSHSCGEQSDHITSMKYRYPSHTQPHPTPHRPPPTRLRRGQRGRGVR